MENKQWLSTSELGEDDVCTAWFYDINTDDMLLIDLNEQKNLLQIKDEFTHFLEIEKPKPPTF